MNAIRLSSTFRSQALPVAAATSIFRGALRMNAAPSIYGAYIAQEKRTTNVDRSQIGNLFWYVGPKLELQLQTWMLFQAHYTVSCFISNRFVDLYGAFIQYVVIHRRKLNNLYSMYCNNCRNSGNCGRSPTLLFPTLWPQYSISECISQRN